MSITSPPVRSQPDLTARSMSFSQKEFTSFLRCWTWMEAEWSLRSKSRFRLKSCSQLVGLDSLDLESEQMRATNPTCIWVSSCWSKLSSIHRLWFCCLSFSLSLVSTVLSWYESVEIQSFASFAQRKREAGIVALLTLVVTLDQVKSRSDPTSNNIEARWYSTATVIVSYCSFKVRLFWMNDWDVRRCS